MDWRCHPAGWQHGTIMLPGDEIGLDSDRPFGARLRMKNLLM
jgi:hypothetical protein